MKFLFAFISFMTLLAGSAAAQQSGVNDSAGLKRTGLRKGPLSSGACYAPAGGLSFRKNNTDTIHKIRLYLVNKGDSCSIGTKCFRAGKIPCVSQDSTTIQDLVKGLNPVSVERTPQQFTLVSQQSTPPDSSYKGGISFGGSRADGTAVFIDGVRVLNSTAPMCQWTSRPMDTLWLIDPWFDIKHISYASQVKIGIRKTEDFTLFFSKPVRANETAVYIDGVRLINH